MTGEITFARNGAIYRGKTRVGQIDRLDSRALWVVRCKLENGLMSMAGLSHDRLRDAKAAARKELCQ